MSKTYKLAGGLVALAALGGLAINYFRHYPVAVLAPKGLIAGQERSLIMTATLLMLIVVVPVLVLTFSIAWRYRASNTKAKHTPNWDHNRWIEAAWWAIPGAIILTLAIITWHASYSLDPFRPIASTTQSVTIDVVALEWKWLFIYPQQGIASVNFAEIPAQTPINFNVTADAPMNSLWIPQLGGQIYAMPGMSTELHLMANGNGSYRGSSANISGDGFASMDFEVRSGSNSDFTAWVQSVRHMPGQLSPSSYAQLAKPNVPNRLSFYGTVTPGLYQAVVSKYLAPQGANP